MNFKHKKVIYNASVSKAKKKILLQVWKTDLNLSLLQKLSFLAKTNVRSKYI